MAAITSPLLIIAGELDIVTKPAAGQVIAGGHPRARFVSVEGANHMGFLERPDVYNGAIVAFASATYAEPTPSAEWTTI